MEGKKVVGGLALGFVSVIVLGIILAFVVFDSGDTDLESTTENTTAESQTVQTEENAVENTMESDATDVFQEETDVTETNSEAESLTEQQTTVEVQQDNIDRTSFYGTWKPSKVEDGMTGEEISFDEAFGNDFYQIENSLTLSEDGSFTLVLGTMKSEDEGKGTFTVNGDSLEVTYLNGDSDIFKLTKDGEGNIIYILVPRYNFTVYFERA